MPRDNADIILVWRVDDTYLAVPLDEVVEVSTVDDDGSARTRDRTVELVTVPGTADPDEPRRVVIVRSGTRWAALPADFVEGVRPAPEARVPPAWLPAPALQHVRGLLPLDDGRLASLLDLRAVLPTT